MLQMVTGTGPSGRVVAEDVEKFVPGAAPPAAAAAPGRAAAAPIPGAGYTDIPMTNIRQVGGQHRRVIGQCRGYCLCCDY